MLFTLQATPESRWNQLQSVILHDNLQPPPDWHTSAPPLTLHAAMEHSQQRMQTVANISSHSVQPATLARRSRIWQEFYADLGTLPHFLGKTAASAQPEDVLSFFVGFWLPQHRGTQLADSSIVAAPGSLQNAVSDLTACFENIGCSGPWQPALSSGNPCKSPDMAKLLKGYSNMLFHSGYAEKAAVPLTGAEAIAALSHLAKPGSKPKLARSSAACQSRRSRTRDLLQSKRSWRGTARGRRIWSLMGCPNLADCLSRQSSQ